MQNFPLVIEPLLPRHAPELMRLRHAALREAPVAFGTDPDWELAKTNTYYHRYLLRITARRRERLLGAWLGNELVGMNGLGMRRHGDHHYGLIYSMFVFPEHRGEKIGEKLLAHSCQHAAEKWDLNHCRITVETHNHNARRLYERNGFVYLFRENAAFTLKSISYDVDHLEKELPPRNPAVPAGKS